MFQLVQLCCILVERHVMVEEQECARGCGSHQLDKIETLVEASHQRRCVGYGGVRMGVKKEG